MSDKSLARVKKCFKLLFPSGHEWDVKTNGGDTEKTMDGYAVEFNRLIESARRLSYFFLPYLSSWIPEVENMLKLPHEDLTDTERQERVDGRFELLFAKKGRLALYELVMHTAGFGDVVVRTLGSNGTAESPYDFFSNVGLTFYGNEAAIYGEEDTIYNNTAVSGDAYLVTNGGSVNYLKTPTRRLYNWNKTRNTGRFT